MIVYRRIFGNIDSRSKKRIIEDCFNKDLGFGYFNEDIDVASEGYQKIKQYVASFNLHDSPAGAMFTNQEIQGAEVLVFGGAASVGYPEPQDENEYQTATYVNYCPACGTYERQKAPFKFTSEPKPGKFKITGLNWVFDEIFADKDFYDSFFKEKGIECENVMNYKNNQQIKSVVQLMIPALEVDLKLKGGELCGTCGITKYPPNISDYFPKPAASFHIVKTKEFFGSGHSAFHRIFVSNEMMNGLIKHKAARIHQFKPTR